MIAVPDLHTRRATGVLRHFDDAGVLAPADVHVAVRLGALAGESDERVLLAVALTVRGTRHGSVVLDLADAATSTASDADDGELVDVAALPWPDTGEWVAACAASPIVTPIAGASAALRMTGTRLWLDRYWRQEQQVADELRRRAADPPGDLDPVRLEHDLDELFPVSDDRDQRAATAAAAVARVSVIGGGPGTGKTTTIARLIAVLRRQRPGLRIALAAPTGKAAARLEEAVRDAAAHVPDRDRPHLDSMTASTLHRLLGRKPGVAGRFRHDRENHLPYDVVIVDECSMMSLTITARLLEALAHPTRLVLVGDPDQLASVEAGAVLGDIVEAGDAAEAGEGAGDAAEAGDGAGDAAEAGDGAGDAAAAGGFAAGGSTVGLAGVVSRLRTVRRFDAGGTIAQLAGHVRAGRADDVLDMLRSGAAEIEFHPTGDPAEPGDGSPSDGGPPDGGAALPPAAQAALREQATHELAVIEAARAGDALAALDALDRHRMLCAHRNGPRGVRFWSAELERRVAELDPTIAPRLDGHYAGQPLLVGSNDYENGLYNGDTGVVVARGDDLVAAFRRGGEPVVLPLVRLSDVRAMHAMTVHRAQGSQFTQVTVLVPVAASPLATRQTFYTAVTRASGLVRVVGSEHAIRTCVERPAARATGLRERLLDQP